MTRTGFVRLFPFCILVVTSCARTVATGGFTPDEHEDRTLRTQIEHLTKGFQGDVGIYVHNLRTGASVAINADDTFPTASMVKVPLMIATFDQAAHGHLFLDSLYTFNDATVIQSDGDDVVAMVKLGSRLPLRKLLYMSTGFSDNTASVWIQSLIGGSQVANAWLEQHGYKVTRDNSRLPERHDIWQRWGWGMTSPREMAGLLTAIRQGRVVSEPASEEMYNLLTHNYWKDDALASIPPWVQAADKSGSVDDSRSEAILVNSASGDYVLCVATRNIKDQSYAKTNEAATMIRRISWTVYHYYNPGDAWRPVWLR